jgi:O-antigen/teichoic acid export membrane protein
MVFNSLFGKSKVSKYTLFGRRIVIIGFAHSIANLQGLILLPIMTKTFGASGYGIWTQIIITILLLQPFIMLGLDSAYLRFLSSKNKKDIGQGVFTVLSIVLITGMISSIILYFSSDILAVTILKEESAGFIFKIASPLLLLGALNLVVLGSFRIFGQIKRYALIIILNTLMEIGLISFFVLSGYGLIGAVISLIITRITTLLIGILFIIFHTGYTRPDYSIIRPYLRYGLPLVPTLIFGFVVSSSDRYVIGYFMGAEKVGIYSAGYNIGNVILMFSFFILYILRPTVYDSFDKKKIDEVRTYLSYSLKYFLLLSIPSVFGLSILSKSLLINLTTTDFIVEGVFIIPLVAISIVYFGAARIFGTVLLFYKQSKLFASIFGIAAILNLGLNMIFVPQFGIIGAAITTFIAYYLLAIIFWYISYKKIKFKIQLDFIFKSIFASIVPSLIIWFFTPPGLIEIFISITIFTIIYFLLIYLLKGFKEKELKIFQEIIGFDTFIFNKNFFK